MTYLTHLDAPVTGFEEYELGAVYMIGTNDEIVVGLTGIHDDDGDAKARAYAIRCAETMPEGTGSVASIVFGTVRTAYWGDQFLGREEYPDLSGYFSAMKYEGDEESYALFDDGHMTVDGSAMGSLTFDWPLASGEIAVYSGEEPAPAEPIPLFAPCPYGLTHYGREPLQTELQAGDGISIENGVISATNRGSSWSDELETDDLEQEISVVTRLTDIRWDTSSGGEAIISNFNKKQLYGPYDLRNVKSHLSVSYCRHEQWADYEDVCDLNVRIWTSGTPSYPHTGSGGRYIHAICAGQAFVYSVMEVPAGIVGREFETSGFGQTDCNIRFFFEGTVTDDAYDYAFTGCLQAPHSLTAGGNCLDHDVRIGWLSENMGNVSVSVQPGFAEEDTATVSVQYNLVSDSLNLFITAEAQNEKTADEVLSIISQNFRKLDFDSDGEEGFRVIPLRVSCSIPMRGVIAHQDQ